MMVGGGRGGAVLRGTVREERRCLVCLGREIGFFLIGVHYIERCFDPRSRPLSLVDAVVVRVKEVAVVLERYEGLVSLKFDWIPCR